ncbi:MAG: hypothetical protein DRP08_07245 [Candidatus Aenigmatarchaeota archaeon]|nr:MAG: hypothetical protein DRP08_07245 [Candidatus Aenigmarchaeota archaeon]
MWQRVFASRLLPLVNREKVSGYVALPGDQLHYAKAECRLDGKIVLNPLVPTLKQLKLLQHTEFAWVSA